MIKKNTPVYRDFKQVMAIAKNKTELFTLIADTLVEAFKDRRETVVVTRLQNVVSNHEIQKKKLEPCEKEEADGRIFLHAEELSRLGFRKTLIITVDTDVVVIGLFAFCKLQGRTIEYIGRFDYHFIITIYYIRNVDDHNKYRPLSVCNISSYYTWYDISSYYTLNIIPTISLLILISYPQHRTLIMQNSSSIFITHN